jgi:hypothetical protein
MARLHRAGRTSDPSWLLHREAEMGGILLHDIAMRLDFVTGIPLPAAGSIQVTDPSQHGQAETLSLLIYNTVSSI